MESDFFLHDWTHKRPLKYIKGSVHEGRNVIKKAKLNSYVQQPLAAFSQLSIHEYSFIIILNFGVVDIIQKMQNQCHGSLKSYICIIKKCMHAILLWHWKTHGDVRPLSDPSSSVKSTGSWHPKRCITAAFRFLFFLRFHILSKPEYARPASPTCIKKNVLLWKWFTLIRKIKDMLCDSTWPEACHSGREHS